MNTYSKTAISITHLKEALLYFDHVIPVSLTWEAVLEGWRLQIPAKEFQLEAGLPPKSLLSEMLPPDLAQKPWFRERLKKANVAMDRLFIKVHNPEGENTKNDDLEVVEFVAKWMVGRIIEDFQLSHVPIIVPPTMITEAGENQQEDVAVSLTSMKLIDAQSASWEQLFEFRRDTDARDKLRRLRLFAYENYSGKSRDFVEDDLLSRISDYEDAIRKWRFDCKSGIVTALLNSKIVQGGLGASVLSSLCHEPLTAIASAGGALALELGRVLLDIRRQHFALRDVMKTNPVSYIGYANEKLAATLNRGS